MLQVNQIMCNKCQQFVDPKEIHYLQLIDDNEREYFSSGLAAALVPKVLWQYSMCKKCFDEFNNSTSHPYKG